MPGIESPISTSSSNGLSKTETDVEPIGAGARKSAGSTEARQGSIFGTVLSESGEAIPNAELVLHVIDTRFAGDFPNYSTPSGLGRIVIDRESLSDANGRFRFESDEAFQEQWRDFYTCVIWCRVPGYAIQLRALSSEQVQGAQLADWVLTAAAATRVLVVGGDGNPLTGAQVRQQGQVKESQGLASMEPEQRFSFAYRFEATTDGDGIALFPRKAGWSRFTCSHEGQATAPWVGEDPTSVNLGMGPVVTLQGRVVFDHNSPRVGFDQVEVVAFANEGSEVLARINVAEDGEWGPIEVSLPDDGLVLVEAQCQDYFGARIRLGPLQQGSSHDVEVGLALGQTLYAYVCDSEMSPITDAIVFAEWSGPNGRGMQKTAPRPDGIAKFTGLPNGAIDLSAHAKGMAHAELYVYLPEIEPATYPIYMSAGRTISGVCLNPDGSPCKSFEVLAWAQATPLSVLRKSYKTESGAFRLENAPAGVVSVVASSSGGLSSDVIHAGVGQDESKVSLRLGSGSTVSGSVFDGNGDPIAGARVQPMKGDVTVLGAVVTDKQGLFELKVPLNKGTGSIGIYAGGFSSRDVSFPSNGKPLIRLDKQVLQAQCDGLVQVLLNPKVNPYGFSVGCDHCGTPPARLDPKGQLRMSDMDAGYHPLVVYLPDGGEYPLAIQLSDEGRNVASLDLRTATATVAVSFEGKPQAANDRFIVSLRHLSTNGRVGSEQVRYAIGTEDPVSFTHVLPGRHRLAAETYGQAILTSMIVEVGEGEVAAAALDFDAPTYKIEVVNSDGHALDSVEVVLSDGFGGAHSKKFTDSNGTATFAVSGSGDYFVNLTKEGVGRHWQIPVEFKGADPGKPITVVMSCDAQLRLRLMDVTGPIRNQDCALQGRGYSIYLGSPKQTDDDGLVTFPDLNEGTYSIYVSIPGYWPYRNRFQTRLDGETQEVLIPRLVDFTVEVQSASGSAVPNQEVRVWSVDYDKDTKYWQTIGVMEVTPADWKTDGAGRVHIPKFPEGNYLVSTVDAKGEAVEIAFEARPGQENVAIVTLP